MKKMICVLLSLLMLTVISCTVYAASDNIGAEPGQTMPDFTVKLTDETSATLSELLKENDLVVLNIFATWCGPCEKEFPDMEKVYEKYSDRMTIISVSGDSDDTMEMVADYKASHSLTFPMGIAGAALDFLDISGYPTTYFITRDGQVGFIKVGAFTGEGAFEEKVNTFLSGDYDGTPLPSEEAHSYIPYLIALITASRLLLTIGRWRLFRKAETPGWYSLIPVLSTFKEYVLCWKGGFGILAVFCQFGCTAISLFSSHSNWAVLCSTVFILVYLVLRVLESMKLAKAFGKGIGTGIILIVFKAVGRFGLGLSRAQYRKPAE